MFSNTFFIHTHKDFAGRPFSHSHPFSPLSSHSHNANEIGLIAAFNLAATTVVNADIISLPQVNYPICELVVETTTAIARLHTEARMLRAPPVVRVDCLIA